MFDFTSHRCDLFFLGAGGATRSSQCQHFSSLVDCLLLHKQRHGQTHGMNKMLAPFLFFFTNLNTMHIIHDVRLFSVTCVRFFFSLSTTLTHDNTHTNNTKGAPRTKPGSRWFWGLGGAHHFFDTSFVCRSHVLGASLRAQAPFLTCMVWQMRTKRAPCRARGMKGGDGFKAANEAALAAEVRPCMCTAHVTAPRRLGRSVAVRAG